jgi:hypothetical protein
VTRTKNSFVRAGTEAIAEEFSGAPWPVFERFGVVHDENLEDVIVYAPLRLSVWEKGEIYPVGDLPQDKGLRRTYAPLREAPDLFLSFAALTRKLPLSRDGALKAMVDWITIYGVLGLEGVICPDEVPRGAANNRSRRESLKGFWHAAWEALRCLELYEVAKPTGSNESSNVVDPQAEAILRKYRASGTTLRAKKEWARIVAADTVGNYVSKETILDFYRTTKQISRGLNGYEGHETIAFGQGLGFRSLLGAMYLQMMNYMSKGGGGRPCKRPGCYYPVSFESAGDLGPKRGSRRKHQTHSNKVFCSPACRQWWSDNLGNSKKARAKRERQQARERREDEHQEV